MEEGIRRRGFLQGGAGLALGASIQQLGPPEEIGTATQLIVELAPGARLVALEQNTARARADDRWELGDRVRIGSWPEHGQVLR